MESRSLIRTLGTALLAPFRYLAKALPPLSPISGARGTGNWLRLGIVREPFTGAWQQNQFVAVDTAVTNPTVFACVTLIASDIGKLSLRLVAEDQNGIWVETDNPAFSPVLRKPNRYQRPSTFVQQWLLSKLLHGNTYVLKERDARGVVVALYILDPTAVQPLVAPDGSVYYQVGRDWLSQVNAPQLAIPAREIIHDLLCPLFHPLIGVPPIFACGYAASQGLTIQQNSAKFFASGSQPGGVLTAPGAIDELTAQRLKTYWDQNFAGDNYGKVAVLGDGLKYEGMATNAVDSELIKQLNWTDEKICSVYHVPGYMVGIGPAPPYANAEPLIQQYYGQCLQTLIVNFEQALDEGLGLTTPISGTQYGTEFDIDDLIWMDSETRAKAAQAASGTLSPNEARAKYYGVGPVTGGQSPMVQQQYYSLAALAQRDAGDPFAKTSASVLPIQTNHLTPAEVATAARRLLQAALERAA